MEIVFAFLAAWILLFSVVMVQTLLYTGNPCHGSPSYNMENPQDVRAVSDYRNLTGLCPTMRKNLGGRMWACFGE